MSLCIARAKLSINFSHRRPLNVAVVILKIAFELVACVLVADFVSGFFHWLEDAYGREDFPIIGRLVTKPNILHHHNPRHFTRNSWWQSSWDLACLCALIAIVAWLSGHMSWHVLVFAFLGANANQIHKWAHRTPQENGRLVRWLQRCRLVQTPRHHAHHHTDPKSSHYCVLTDFLNPILDRLRVWTFLECIIWLLFGIRRRTDTSVSPLNETVILPGKEMEQAAESIR
ncbi:MAG TPA: fatty acid desaturase CarF family protein [Candidatus Limnocylindria bacterium]|nr:fatty acid desaturase CarF family protein [Candidatus Limnocylindria bacterium]